MHAAQKKEDLVLLRRQKRRNAKKKLFRDYLSFDDAQICFNLTEHVHSDPYVAARTKIALILLYFSGLRISNLLTMQVQHLHEIVDTGHTHIDLIKRGRQRQLILAGSPAQQMLKDHMHFVNIICDNKEENHFLFTTKQQVFQAIHRVPFNRSINAVLKVASLQLKKNILSHSFRISVITDLIAKQGIENTQDYMDHSSILTTKLYHRRSPTDKEFRDTLNEIQKQRALDYKRTRIGRMKVHLNDSTQIDSNNQE